MVVGLRADARLVAVWIGCIVSLFISLDTPAYIYIYIYKREIQKYTYIYIYVCLDMYTSVYLHLENMRVVRKSVMYRDTLHPCSQRAYFLCVNIKQRCVHIYIYILLAISISISFIFFTYIYTGVSSDRNNETMHTLHTAT